MAEDIARISKRFLEDRDDSWMLYLPASDHVQLRNKRTEYHALMEQLESLKDLYKATKDEGLKKELRDHKQTLNNFIRALIPKLRAWKDLGTMRGIEEANRNPIFKSSKRPRLDNQTNSTQTQDTDSQDRLDNRLFAQEQAARSLVQGVESESDRKVLRELKTLIARYECRDRVLKALESINRRDTGLNGLKSFTGLLNMK